MINKEHSLKSCGIDGGNIIPAEAIYTMLYHPICKLLFKGTPNKWLPVGMANNDAKRKVYGLMVDTRALKPRLSGIPVIAAELKAPDNSVIDLLAKFPATRFHSELPSPYVLLGVGPTDRLTAEKFWQQLQLSLDYIDSLHFFISPIISEKHS